MAMEMEQPVLKLSITVNLRGQLIMCFWDTQSTFQYYNTSKSSMRNDAAQKQTTGAATPVPEHDGLQSSGADVSCSRSP